MLRGLDMAGVGEGMAEEETVWIGSCGYVTVNAMWGRC